MPKTAYNISLKGYVGSWDFNRTDVDKTLAENEAKHVYGFAELPVSSFTSNL